jgi:type II secretory pathway pseudopilin PulG
MRQPFIKAAIFWVAMLSLTVTRAQNVQTKSPSVFNALPATVPDVLRVQNGLLSHRVSGTIGLFGASDQWIGVGAPLSSLYGERTQWNGQAFIKALRSQNPAVPTAIKDAILEWGNQGGEMQFRYITNPLLPTGFTRILTLNSSGNAFFGASPTPILTGTPKLSVNSDGSGNPAVSAAAIDAPAGEFQGFASEEGVAQGMLAYIASTSRFNTNTASRGMVVGMTESSNNIGTSGQVVSSRNTGSFASSIAVQGEVFGLSENGFQAGLYGQIFDSYAVAGFATNTGVTYAGYFQGDVFSTGQYIGSDKRLKEGIAQETDAIGLLSKLNPVTYNYAADKYKGYNLPTTKQHGLLAQEVQAVLPELVKINRYITRGEKDKPQVSEDFLAVNYQGFIPLLIKAVQEQQGQLTQQQSQLQQQQTAIETLKAALASLSTVQSEKPVVTKDGRFKSSQFVLEQNTPNPFSSTTTIRYALPDGIRNATLAVFDLNGRMLLQYNNLNGSAQLTINGNTLQAGMYIYTLLAEGQEVASKRMILTK